MKPNSMMQTTRYAREAFLLTFLYLPLMFLGVDDLIPENSRLGRMMNRSLEEKETLE